MCCVTGWSANIEHHSIHSGEVPRAVRTMETGFGMGTPEMTNGWSIWCSMGDSFPWVMEEFCGWRRWWLFKAITIAKCTGL